MSDVADAARTALLVSCPVCSGRGGWSRETFRPVSRAECSDRMWHRCPYCRGERKTMPPGSPS